MFWQGIEEFMLKETDLDIRFAKRDAFTVTGYAIETDLAASAKDIGSLWDKNKDNLLSIPTSDSCLYGVMWYTKNHRYYYLLGIHGENITMNEAAQVKIPAARFAVASVPGDMPAVEAWTIFFEKDLPALKTVPDAEHGRYFEFYGQDEACELWTPVIESKNAHG
jgi:AraC family transcriptional regulator